MPPAVLKPSPATLPATRKASPIGSGPRWAGCRRAGALALAPARAGRFATRGALGRADRVELVLFFAVPPRLLWAAAREAVARFALRCPGRARGRLPRTVP